MITLVDGTSRVDPSVGREIGPGAADDMDVKIASGKDDVGNRHTIDSRRRRGKEDAKVIAELALKKELFVALSPKMSTHRQMLIW